MSQMTVIAFAIYLLALLLAPLIAAFRLGVGAALRMAAIEVGLVVASWLLISFGFSFVTMLIQGTGVASWYEESLAVVGFGWPLLLAIPLLSILAALTLAWVGLALRAIWRGLRS